MKTKTNLIVQDAMKAVSSQVRLPECIRNGKIKNMTQYKLIKTPEQFIIVSNENIEKEDIYYNTRLQNIYEAIANSGYNTVDKEFKVIAQQNQIDFNGFEDIVGYVDVEKLAKEANGYLPYARDTKGLAFNEGYIEGFNKANELSSSKQFTLEDMEYCYNTAKRRAVMQEAGLEADLGFKNYIDTYHQKPKEWMIEIAMEQYTQNYHKDIWYNRPLLINGKIQITKIL